MYSYAAERIASILKNSEGRPMTLRVPTRTIDPATNKAIVINTDYSVYGRSFPFKNKDVDGTNVRVGDLRVLIGGDCPVAPTTAHQIIDGGVTRAILVVVTRRHGFNVLAYEVHAR